MLLKGWTPSNIWGFGSLKTSLRWGMLLKSTLTPGELSVWSTDNITSIPLPEALNQLYVSFMRPHLEYAAPVWDPHLQKDIGKLEKVQKFALRMCTKNWMAGYDDLLNTCCNIPSLKTRRLYLKLVFLYQLVNDLIVYPSHGVSYRNFLKHKRITCPSSPTKFLFGILCL